MGTAKAVWLVIPAWLMTVIAGFWWIEYRHWQRLETLAVAFNGQDIQDLHTQLGSQDTVTVMHFVNTLCPCHAYSESHIERLQPVLATTKQVTLTSANAPQIPATPSVAIWDGKGELAYFGPYSSGAVCGQGKDFVTRVLGELEQNNNPRWINTVGIGCYCSGQYGEVSHVQY